MEQKKKRPTRQQRRSSLIINALTLIVLVLIVFEGKSLISLFSRQNIQERIRREEEEVFAEANILSTETENAAESEAADSAQTESQPQTEEQSTVSQTEAQQFGLPDGGEQYIDCVLPAQENALDDSYFQDAVFIGDSRMEGFRNFSGITKGSFLTAVGMQLENFYTDAQIATANGFVPVMDALKNINFTKIYMMLGTNELGAYDISSVHEAYRKVLNDIKTRSASPDPEVYVYSVIYVEEALVTTGDYVNNQNVDAVNLEILKMCQEEGYHYINLNEIFSNGYHALISGASSDGIHLEQPYCQEWLEYTKTHYVPDKA